LRKEGNGPDRTGKEEGLIVQGVSVANAVPTGAVSRKAKLLLLGLLVAVTVALVMPGKAEASYGGWADSDGYVPVYSACYPGVELGYYHWYYDGYAVYGTVYINDCALARLGAGPYDRQRVIAHEMGHAWGLPHSLDPNSYMYWYYEITGT
jgi:hypothetical protein